MEAEMETSWFWDQIFSNQPQEDWDTDTHSAAVEGLGIDLDAAEWSPWDDLNIDHTNGCSVNSLSLPTEDWDTDTHSAAVEGLDIDLDAAEWSPWDDLNIDHTNGCSVNSLSLPTDLQKIEDYLIDAELEFGDAINIEEDPILSPRRDHLDLDSTDGPVIIKHPVLIAEDQSVSDCAATDRAEATNKSKSIETGLPIIDVDHGAQLEDMEYKGLRLLHLLIACAEAMSLEAQDLVEVILCRLRKLVSPTGSTMERVAYYLFDALFHSNVNSLAPLEPNDKSTEEIFMGALKLLHVAYPYIRIPHFTANECILEAIAAAGGANVGIHIIDFDIMEGTQWPPLMAALTNNRNYHVGHLKITSIKWAEDECLLYSGHTGRRLTECASSVGIPFLFQERDLEGLKELLPQEGEIVIVNCIWQLPHMVNLRNKSQLWELLVGTRHLNPVAVTLATGPHGAKSDTADFLQNFTRRLQELCTIFDSLEAGLPEHELARAIVERIFFGPAMSRRVISSACCDDGPVDSRESNIVDLPLKCGYGEGCISNDNIIYAKYNLLCSGVSGSYEVELVGRHRLVLKWASTPLVWVSTWKSP